MDLFKRFNIGKRITAGYLAVLLIMVICGIYCVTVFQRSIDIDSKISETYLPSLDATKSFGQFITRSQRLTKNWIYQPNEEEKQELKEMTDNTFNQFVIHLKSLKQNWQGHDLLEMNDILAATDTLIASEKKIMSLLNDISSYDDAEKIDRVIYILENEVDHSGRLILEKVENLRRSQEKMVAGLQNEKGDSFSFVKWVIIFSLVLIFTVGILATFFTTRSITRPVNELRQSIMALSQGELKEVSIKKSNDEIGDMIESCNILINGLRKTTEFTEHISAGRLDVQYTSLSNIKALDNALFNMRESLTEVTKSEEKRNWVITGLAQFSEILRNQHDFNLLSDQIITGLVKYIKANQGGLFIVNDDDLENKYLQLLSCYAWDKKKFVEKKIEWGEGLTGQAWQEKEMIYLTDVPKDYVNITSGLGMALPRSVIILPLKLNDEVFGVIELASFNGIAAHEQEFLLKVCEIIASTLSSAKVASQTKLLLAQTQQQAEEMRSQEEEMRQNMEELSATQEEMVRKEQEYLKRIKALEMLSNEKQYINGSIHNNGKEHEITVK